MSNFPRQTIIDDIGRFSPDERSGMLDLGIRVELPDDPIAEAMRVVHELSEQIAKIDGMKSPDMLASLMQQRADIQSIIPEIGY